MSDPRRLRVVDPGSFEATLLESLREQQPQPDAKARALAAVAAASLGTHAALGVHSAQALAQGKVGSLAVKVSGLALKGSTALAAKLSVATLAVGIAAGSIALRTEPQAPRAQAVHGRSREAPVAARHASTRTIGQPTGAVDQEPAPSTLQRRPLALTASDSVCSADSASCVLAGPRSSSARFLDSAEHPLRHPQSAQAVGAVATPDLRPAPERTRGIGSTPRAPSASAVGHEASRAPTKSSLGPRLAHEVDALTNVKRSLEVASPATALEQLDLYDRAFPQGELRAEAGVLRIEVLLSVGRTTEARKLAREWLQREPAGPYAAKLKRLVALTRSDASESAIELPHAGQ